MAEHVPFTVVTVVLYSLRRRTVVYSRLPFSLTLFRGRRSPTHLVRTGSRSPEVSRTGSPLFPQLAGRNPRQVAKSATGVPKTWGVTREARVEGNLIGAWRTLLFLPFISTPKENTHMVVPLSANQRKQLTHEDPSLLLFKIRVNRTTKLLTAGCS